MSYSTVSESDAENTATTVSDLSQKREAEIDDAGNTYPEVPLETFFEQLLPLRKCLKQHSVVDTVMQKLKDGDDALLKHDTTTDSFVWQNTLPKQTAKEKRVSILLDKIARHIEEIMRGLGDELGETLEPVVEYTASPTTAPESLNRASDHIPDSYFILRKRQEGGLADYWIDIGVVGEFKRGNNGKSPNKDLRQIVWDMHYMLQEDARRRFTLGFTIEARSMRLWYVSRAGTFISREFDFMTSPELLVQFFLSVTYSYEHQLGWDPTMKYVAATKDMPRHLVISVRSPDRSSTMSFRTLEILSNIGANTIRGRGTRVWRVEGLTQDGNPLETPQTFVLKDSWIDPGRDREGAIIDLIRKDADILPDNGKSVLLNALLTVKIYGDVWIAPEDAAGVEQGFYDCTFTGEQRNEIWPPGSPRLSLRGPAIDDNTEETTSIESQSSENSRSTLEDQSDEIPPQYDPKMHSRIVFYEVCKPIHDERSLQKVCLALAGATTALQALHLSGWVHKDISSGNILLWHNQIKIADLEFAERFTKMKSAEELQNSRFHKIRIGTPRYMSLEAAAGRFLIVGYVDRRIRKSPEVAPLKADVPLSQQEIDFLVAPRAVDTSRKYDPMDRPLRSTSPAKSDSPTVVWQYHPLHDLESLYWLCNELTINRDLYFAPAEYPDCDVYAPEGGETVDERRERVKRQARAAESLRPSNALNRTYCLTALHYFAGLLETTHPLLRRSPPGEDFCSVTAALEEFRNCVYKAYIASSVDPSKITNLVAFDIYPHISRTLHKAARSLKMNNYIPSIRPLPMEFYTVRRQDENDIVREIEEAMNKAKEVSPVTQSEVSTMANNEGAARKRKRETSVSGVSAQPLDGEEEASPEVPQLPTRAAKKRKTVAGIARP